MLQVTIQLLVFFVRLLKYLIIQFCRSIPLPIPLCVAVRERADILGESAMVYHELVHKLLGPENLKPKTKPVTHETKATVKFLFFFFFF